MPKIRVRNVFASKRYESEEAFKQNENKIKKFEEESKRVNVRVPLPDNREYVASCDETINKKTKEKVLSNCNGKILDLNNDKILENSNISNIVVKEENIVELEKEKKHEEMMDEIDLHASTIN